MLTYSPLLIPSISSLHFSIKRSKLVLKDIYPFLSIRLLNLWRENKYISGLEIKASNPISINFPSSSTKYNILHGTLIKSLSSQVYLALISLQDIHLYIACFPIVCYATKVVDIIVFLSILNI